MPTRVAPPSIDTVVRLRMSVARLARLMRQQDQSGFGPTVTAALATIEAGPITPGELAAREQVAPPTITKVLDKLEAQGLVTRVADATDRRVRRVAITAAGRRQLDAARTRRTAWLAERVASLNADELARLQAAIDVLETLVGGPGLAHADPPPTGSGARGGARP